MYFKQAKYIDSNEECRLVLREYHDGTPALCIESVEWPEPVATVSSNLGDHMQACLGEDEIFVKTYSENEGIYDDLIAAGVLTDCGKSAFNGFADFPIAKINKEKI